MLKTLLAFLLLSVGLSTYYKVPKYVPGLNENSRNLNLFLTQTELQNTDFDSTKFLSSSHYYFARENYVHSYDWNWAVTETPTALKFEDLNYVDPSAILRKINDIRIIELAAIGDTAVPTPSPSPNPYYIRKFEVTNYEYRLFVHWVRDSIARTMMGTNDNAEKWLLPTKDSSGFYEIQEKWKLNWKPDLYFGFPRNSDEPNYREILSEMFYPPHERFKIRRELDTRKLIYKWLDGNTERIVKVYPDTLVWMHDHSDRHFEVLTKSYFSHPAYDMYPVVGLSYDQVLAYCHWKEKMLNQYLARKKREISG